MKLSISSVLLIAGWIGAATAEIPAVCYDTCNSALREGQTMGWTNPALCQWGGPFWTAKLNCWICCYNNNFPGMKFEGTQFEIITKWC